jgi:hypothetical protein
MTLAAAFCFGIFAHQVTGLLATASRHGFLWRRIATLLAMASRHEFLRYLVTASPPPHLVCHIMLITQQSNEERVYLHFCSCYLIFFSSTKNTQWHFKSWALADIVI